MPSKYGGKRGRKQYERRAITEMATSNRVYGRGAMTAFQEQQPRVIDSNPSSSDQPREGKRPPRWAVSNWPVGRKVFALVLVPLLIAVAFGGVYLHSGWTQARDLRLAADRADVVPAIEKYLTAFDEALLVNSTGGDAQASLTAFDTGKANLRGRLADTDVTPAARTRITGILDDGQSLLDQVTASSIDLPGRLSAYSSILSSAEDAVTESVRADDANVRAETQGLSRAVGIRGQTTMQQLLVNLGGELPEPQLRTSMISLAGADPSTQFGMAQVPGVSAADAQTLKDESAKRMAIVSDPAATLVGNPDLSQSLQATDEIATKIIGSTTTSVTAAADDLANAERRDAIRDSAIAGGAILLALVIALLVARTLVRPMRQLRDGALRVAHEDLPRELEQMRTGGTTGPVRLLPVYTTEELGQVAHAVDELHEQAIFLAGEQAGLQLQLGDMFETLSRRSRSLVDQQLGLIDRLERNEEDPERLQSLFELDHLAARMRRNGANLLVLAGARRPREQGDPVSVGALINAAASEVEDYARIVTTEVPDGEVLGGAADDLVHVLAELLDNALRYSPPAADVRVSAVHTDDGGLVIEVADSGLGMTDADLRMSNTRLQSGGEVNPYTARHMGLFVVGRIAAQHGLVVRLRNTIAGQSDSGTTAGVFIPVKLLPHGSDAPESGSYDDDSAADSYDYDVPAEAHLALANPVALDDHDEYRDHDDAAAPADYRNANSGANSDIPISLLPQRNPGASGISDIPFAPAEPVDDTGGREDEQEWPRDDWPPDATPTRSAGEPARWHLPVESSERPVPTDTSSFFAAKAQASNQAAGVTNGGQHPAPAAPAGGSIFEKMLSEWLIDDPTELAKSTDLDWQTVWDQGWSAAAAAEQAPVSERTEQGLPVRQPGARLIPGAAATSGENGNDARNGTHRVAEASTERDDATVDTGPIPILRDAEAVRTTIGSHFSGVRAGRSHARDRATNGGETDRE